MSIAVTRSTRSGQSCDGSRWAITSRRTDSATVSVASAIAPIRCSFCSLVAPGVDIAVTNSVGDVVDVDAGVDLVGRLGDLAGEQLVEGGAAAELRGHRRSRRGAQQHVGGQQRRRRVGRLVGDAAQDAGLPGDAGQSTAGEHQSTFLTGTECARRPTLGFVARTFLLPDPPLGSAIHATNGSDMADTMRAQRFYADTKTIAVEDVPIPEPGPGEVLVKVAFCGICHSDLSLINGTFPAQLPVVTQGHEASGTIAKLGPGVTGWAEGDRVVVAAGKPCLDCVNCRRGDMSNCLRIRLMAFAYDGAWAEYTVAQAFGLTRIPDNVPLEQAAILADAVSTPYGAVVRTAKVGIGESVGRVGRRRPRHPHGAAGPPRRRRPDHRRRHQAGDSRPRAGRRAPTTRSTPATRSCPPRSPRPPAAATSTSPSTPSD